MLTYLLSQAVVETNKGCAAGACQHTCDIVATARFSQHAAAYGNGARIVSTHPARLSRSYRAARPYAAGEPVTSDVVRTVVFRLFPEGRRPAGSSSPSALVR
jgi:hypothetical protein